VYRNDARAREDAMTPDERLRFQQQHSKSILDALHGWLGAQFAERRVEPHTCQLCGANSFDYLAELQRHARELTASPAEWMPWNYRETLARLAV
jgi:hypothetical protein